MPARRRCPQCSAEMSVRDDLLGKVVRCPSCWNTFRAEVEATTRRVAATPIAPPPERESRGLLVAGLVAAVAFLFLIVIAGGAAMWWFWPRPSSASTPVAAAPPPSTPPVENNPAPAPQPQNNPPPAVQNNPPPAVQNNPPPVVQNNPPPAPQAAPPADGAPFHLADVRKSVVFIRRSVGAMTVSGGTGFFVTADGLIATNRHVIQAESGPNPATVLYVGVPSADDPDKLDYFKAQVAYCPPQKDTLDFALLKIAARPGYQPFRPLALAPAGTKMQLGDKVAAIGFPFADPEHPELSFNQGNISSTRKEIEDHPYYQTDAAVNPGNSGGPLINADGQVVGVVSRKRDDANNMGFALYLSETGLPDILNQDKVARLTPEAGPLDPKQLPSGTIKPTRLADWDVTHGKTIDPNELKGKEVVVAHNDGAAYWLTYKDPLPENFQLNVDCLVLPLLPDRPQLPFGPQMHFGPRIGPPPIGPQPRVNMNTLQSLYVRFGDDAVNDDIVRMSGTTVHMSAALLRVGENGGVVGTHRKGIPDDPFMLTLTRRGDELTVAVDGEVWMTQKLQRALPGSHKFSVGGVQSGLVLHAVSIAPIDGPPVPPPLADAPKPGPGPAGPAAGQSFEAGWDKLVDPDGDCTFTPNKGALTIEVPAGKRHDLVLDQNVLNAPRLLRDVTGDFTVQVRVDADFSPTAPSTSPVGLPYLGAGLVLASGEQTFLRLERAGVKRGTKTASYVNWDGRSVGKPNWSGNAGLGDKEPPMYLRLRRQGDRFFASYSRDGANWNDLPAQDVKLPAAVKVGVIGVSTSTGPLKASFDDFRLAAGGDAPPADPANPNPPKPPNQGALAAQPPAGWKGPQWTDDLDKMKFPDAAASGWVMGGEFKVESATQNAFIGWITLRQGQDFAPGAYLTLMLPKKSLAELEGKTITVNGKQEIQGLIWAHLGKTPAGENQPKVQIFGEYTMKLEFGKVADGKLPGKIYICLPDDAHSVIAGTFQLESK